MPDALHPFENHEVVGTSVVLRKAGDGLSAALKVDPAEYEHGETVAFVGEGKCTKVSYVPSKDDPEKLIRVHDIETTVLTPVEGPKVKGMIASHRKKLEAAEGVSKLPGLDESEGDDGE